MRKHQRLMKKLMAVTLSTAMVITSFNVLSVNAEMAEIKVTTDLSVATTATEASETSAAVVSTEISEVIATTEVLETVSTEVSEVIATTEDLATTEVLETASTEVSENIDTSEEPAIKEGIETTSTVVSTEVSEVIEVPSGAIEVPETASADIPEEFGVENRIIIWLGQCKRAITTAIPEYFDISFRSLDNSIAKVNSQGKVKAVNKGETAIITTVVVNGKTVEYKTKVVVKDSVTKATVTKNASVKVGKTKKLKVKVPIGKLESVNYSSSDDEIATVNEFGKITAKKRGMTTITTTLKVSGVTKKFTTTVKVKKATV